MQISTAHKSILLLYILTVSFAGFLHYPFGKYRSTTEITVVRGEGECPKAATSAEDFRSMTADQMRQRVLCRQAYSETVDRPILEWYSEEPLIAWFYSLAHTLSFIAFLTFIALVAAVFSKTSNTRRTEA